MPGPRLAYRRPVREVVAPSRVRRVADERTAALALRRVAREVRRRRSAARGASTSSIRSIASVLSVGSIGSVLSIGSAGSLLSIGSAGSVLSIGSSGGVLSHGDGDQGRRARAGLDGVRTVGPRTAGALLAILALAHAAVRR